MEGVNGSTKSLGTRECENYWENMRLERGRLFGGGWKGMGVSTLYSDRE